MKRDNIDEGIPTLAAALSHMNADELKVLASLMKSSAPTRKAELVAHIDYRKIIFFSARFAVSAVAFGCEFGRVALEQTPRR